MFRNTYPNLYLAISYWLLISDFSLLASGFYHFISFTDFISNTIGKVIA
jgi:hypothetical protein